MKEIYLFIYLLYSLYSSIINLVAVKGSDFIFYLLGEPIYRWIDYSWCISPREFTRNFRCCLNEGKWSLQNKPRKLHDIDDLSSKLKKKEEEKVKEKEKKTYKRICWTSLSCICAYQCTCIHTLFKGSNNDTSMRIMRLTHIKISPYR